MGAFVRSVKVSTFHGATGTVSRGDARTGDTLIAFQSADSGGHGALSLDGEWLFTDDYPGGVWPGTSDGVWAGTIVWKRVCAANEPTSYTAHQGPNADGIYVIAAIAGADDTSVVSDNASGTTAPDVTPLAASGIEFRYAAGVPHGSSGGATVSWQHPTGTTELADAQSGSWTSCCLASKPIVSSAPVGQAAFVGSNVTSAGAFTVLIGSADDPSAPPPVVPPSAPGRGRATWRYVVNRLLSREYLGDLDDLLVNVDFDKRILQPGVFNGVIPIPSTRVADRVAEMIPRENAGDPDSYPLDRGPGVISIQVLRLGEPYEEYWITGSRLVRSRRGNLGIALRGNSLEAYLGAVEIEYDLSYSGDQIAIARSLLNHLMAQSNSNISLELESGTSGVSRSVTYLESEGGTYGRRLVDFAQLDGGFEHMINLEKNDAGQIIRKWVWGYPKLGQPGIPHTWAGGRYNGDILEYTEDVDVLRGFTRVRARGNSISTDASTSSVPLLSTPHEATAHLAAGWPRTSRTLTYPNQTDLPTLEDYAAYWVERAAGAVRVDMATVALGKEVTFTPNHLGDYGRFYLRNQWHPGVWRTRRVIGIGITPNSKQSGKEEAKLVLEGTEAP